MFESFAFTDSEVKKSMDFVSESFKLAIKQRVIELTSTPSPSVPPPQEGNLT
jgi:hypothetical protein